METLSQLDGLNVDELLDVVSNRIYESELRLKEKSKRLGDLNNAISDAKREMETVLQTRQRLAKQIDELVSFISTILRDFKVNLKVYLSKRGYQQLDQMLN